MEQVDEEVQRLRTQWRSAEPEDGLDALLGGRALDRFDRVQLAEVVRVCRASSSLSSAGRTLFAVSRQQRTTVNDADRLRKYLSRHGLSWSDLTS